MRNHNVQHLLPATFIIMALMGGAPVNPGDILANKYRVERVLGEGSFGLAQYH